MRVAHAEGRDWKKELPKFLLAYRSTPHMTTGVSPAKLLFGREIRPKLPGLEDLRPVSSETEFLDRDRERKQKGKDYADNLRGACESNLKEGDKVLLRQPKSDKLSPSLKKSTGNKCCCVGSIRVLDPSVKSGYFVKDIHRAHLNMFENKLLVSSKLLNFGI